VSERDKPLVTICCMTYNHGSYIDQCLAGFVKQQTDFSFEIIVHDDASTDNTVQVIRSYELSYPEIFRCIYQSKNQFLKKHIMLDIILPKARGNYIALCEGDDYWTDSSKLQKQVDFLKSNKDYSLVYHNVHTNRDSSFSFQNQSNHTFDLNNSLRVKQGATLTMLFRNDKGTNYFPRFLRKMISTDWGLEIILLTLGRGYYMKEPMGFYRNHESGITKESDFIRKANKAKWYFILRMIFWSPKHMASFLKFLYKNRAWVKY